MPSQNIHPGRPILSTGENRGAKNFILDKGEETGLKIEGNGEGIINGSGIGQLIGFELAIGPPP
jgi:hypothetical protein